MNLGATGKKGEDMVARFLQKQGCTVLKRNYSCRFGEIDIVAQKSSLLIFVEVKTRKESALVSGKEAVDVGKIKRLTLAAQDYLSKCPELMGFQPRFDVAEVTVTQDNPSRYKLNYIKNAF